MILSGEPVWRGRKACRPHTLNAVKLAREHKNSRRWSRSHHVFQKMKMGNGRIRPRSGRISGAPKASEPIVGLGCRVRVSVRASHGQNTSRVGIFAYLLKKSSFGVADFSSAPNNPPACVHACIAQVGPCIACCAMPQPRAIDAFALEELILSPKCRSTGF